jgi:hypothetical protein
VDGHGHRSLPLRRQKSEKQFVESAEEQGSFSGLPWKEAREKRPQRSKFWEAFATGDAAVDEGHRVLTGVAFPEVNGTIVAFRWPRARLVETIQEHLIRVVSDRRGAVEGRNA